VAKRLLTDPSPELRSSLQDLLFKDGSFRWNRLENLLRNARNNSDYNLGQALNQGVDYLFSERGEFIRIHLINEIVRGLDTLGNTALHNLTYSVRERLGFTVSPRVDSKTSPQEAQQVLGHIQRIWGILQDTPGFNAGELLALAPQLLFKPETHQMGQKIAEQLASRMVTRLIREVLIADEAASSLATTAGLRRLPQATVR
jgi:hypothetical protein